MSREEGMTEGARVAHQAVTILHGRQGKVKRQTYGNGSALITFALS